MPEEQPPLCLFCSTNNDPVPVREDAHEYLKKYAALLCKGCFYSMIAMTAAKIRIPQQFDQFVQELLGPDYEDPPIPEQLANMEDELVLALTTTQAGLDLCNSVQFKVTNKETGEVLLDLE